MKHFSDQDSIQDLITFLETKGQNHNWYYHYTTWDSFVKIYTGKSFLLTRGNASKINDQHEAIMKGSYEEWNKTYLASFSFGSAENMAMWGLYGLPWEDAVRIAIPKKEMLNWLHSIHNAEKWGENNNGGSVELCKVCLNDIVYVNGDRNDPYYQLTHADNHWTVNNEGEFAHVGERPIMTGYIKNFAWSYEHEVRLKITIRDHANSDKIKISIPDSTISSLIITTGPSFTDKHCGLFEQLRSDGKILPSDFQHLVKYRPLCELCQHNFIKNCN